MEQVISEPGTDEELDAAWAGKVVFASEVEDMAAQLQLYRCAALAFACTREQVLPPMAGFACALESWECRHKAMPSEAKVEMRPLMVHVHGGTVMNIWICTGAGTVSKAHAHALQVKRNAQGGARKGCV